MSGWRTMDSVPKDGTVFFAYWGDLPVMCAVMPDGRTIRVVTLARDGHFAPHGNYSPFTPSAWQPLPENPRGKSASPLPQQESVADVDQIGFGKRCLR